MHMKLKIFCMFLWNNFTVIVRSAYHDIVLLHNFFIYKYCLVYILPKFLQPQDIDIPLSVKQNMVIFRKFIQKQLAHPYTPASQLHKDR